MDEKERIILTAKLAAQIYAGGLAGNLLVNVKNSVRRAQEIINQAEKVYAESQSEKRKASKN